METCISQDRIRNAQQNKPHVSCQCLQTRSVGLVCSASITGALLWKNHLGTQDKPRSTFVSDTESPIPHSRNAGGPHPGRVLKFWSCAGHLHSQLSHRISHSSPHPRQSGQAVTSQHIPKDSDDCHASSRARRPSWRTPRISRQDWWGRKKALQLETHSGDKGSQRMFQLPRVQRSEECAPCPRAPSRAA